MSKYRSLNYTELSSIDIDNFNIIGVFKLTGATGTLPSDLTFPCIFGNYEGFQILRKYDKIYNRQKSGASWSSWKELDLNATSFLSLSDIPNSYIGFQGKLLRVNPNGTGLEFDNFSYSTYSKMKVGNSFPTSPNHSDLFYNQTNNTLWRYDAISSNWIPIDWQTIIKASPEYQANRLRVNSITGKLEISPDGTTWYECIPAVGNETTELMTFDNSYFSYKYWIAPGQIVIIRGANHIPIVYAKDVEPFFDGAYWHSYPYQQWIGIRPSNILISDGDGQFMGANSYTVSAYRLINLSIVPIHHQANNNENWANFTLRIRNNQRFLNNSIGLGSLTYVLSVTNCSGTASNLSYWLGTWYTDSWVNFQVNVLTLTRRA